MNPGKLAYAMNDIDEDLIFDAIAYRPEKRAPKPVRRLAALAACLVLAAAIFGAAQRFAGQPAPGFVLTVYALENGDDAVQQTLNETDAIPVDLFYTDNGAPVFAFSYEAADKDAPVHSSCVYGRTDFTGSVRSVTGMKEQRGHVYVYFLPDLQAEPPYDFTFQTASGALETNYAVSVSITEENGAYSARLLSVEEVENVSYGETATQGTDTGTHENLDELLKPYLDVIDKLNAAGDYGLYIPDDQKETFYNTYKDLTPEAFEAEVRRQLEEAETGDYSEAPAGQTVTIEGTLEEKSEDQLFEQSSLIIRGTVDEAIKIFQIQSVFGQIGNFTDYKITVQDVLRGSTDDEIVTVRVRGGTAGGVTEICSPVPELNAGEEYLLFLYQPGRGGTFNTRGDYYYVLGLPQGTFQRATRTAEPQTSDVFTSQTGYEISYSRILDRANEYPVDTDYFRKEYLANQKLNLENGFITQNEYQKSIENIDAYASVVSDEMQ